jgi:hypothetical protein
MPSSEDYIVPTAEWTARHVYNFVRGVATPEQPVKLVVDGQVIKVIDAISYSQIPMDSSNDLAHEGRADGELRAKCKDGEIRVQCI